MTSLFYLGKGGDPPEKPLKIPYSNPLAAADPRRYLADEGAVDAVNSALLLGQPILLTGEPGTGKTQLAGSVASELGFGTPLRFDSKSDSKARDLFYIYDAVGRFQATHSEGASKDIRDYITYNALGKAILFANEPDDVRKYLPKDFEHPGRRRSVVLVDEIDKTPRDFPNDILAEIEEMYFRMPEFGNVKVSAEPSMRPVVVITSNSEKNLPDAFLRRCVFYHIPFPGRDRLLEIVRSRAGHLLRQDDSFLNDALDLFDELRRDSLALFKKPATAELLAWIIALRRLDESSTNPLAKDPDRALATLSILVKTKEDLERSRPVVQSWIARRT